MNRRHFITGAVAAITGLGSFSILPPATTYRRIWKATVRTGFRHRYDGEPWHWYPSYEAWLKQSVGDGPCSLSDMQFEVDRFAESVPGFKIIEREDSRCEGLVGFTKFRVRPMTIDELKSWDGNGSGRNTAELRVQTGQERINEHYDCQMFPAGKYKKGDVLP